MKRRRKPGVVPAARGSSRSPEQQAETGPENEQQDRRNREEDGIGVPLRMNAGVIRARFRDVDQDAGVGAGDRVGDDDQESSRGQLRGRYRPAEMPGAAVGGRTLVRRDRVPRDRQAGSDAGDTRVDALRGAVETRAPAPGGGEDEVFVTGEGGVRYRDEQVGEQRGRRARDGAGYDGEGEKSREKEEANPGRPNRHAIRLHAGVSARHMIILPFSGGAAGRHRKIYSYKCEHFRDGIALRKQPRWTGAPHGCDA